MGFPEDPSVGVVPVGPLLGLPLLPEFPLAPEFALLLDVPLVAEVPLVLPQAG